MVYQYTISFSVICTQLLFYAVGDVVAVPTEEQSVVTAHGTILEREDQTIGKHVQKPKLGGDLKTELEEPKEVCSKLSSIHLISIQQGCHYYFIAAPKMPNVGVHLQK